MASHAISHVVHLAAQAGVRYSLYDPAAYVTSNIECLLVLLDVLRQFPVSVSSHQPTLAANNVDCKRVRGCAEDQKRGDTSSLTDTTVVYRFVQILQKKQTFPNVQISDYVYNLISLCVK